MTIADIVLNEADVMAGVLLAKTNAISTEGVALNETSTVYMNHYMLLAKTDVFNIKIVALDEVNVIHCVWLIKIDVINIENVALNAADVMEAIPIDDFIIVTMEDVGYLPRKRLTSRKSDRLRRTS